MYSSISSGVAFTRRSTAFSSFPAGPAARGCVVDMPGLDFCQTASTSALNTALGRADRFGWLSRLQQPPEAAPQQTRALDQAEEVVLPHQNLKVSDAVAAVLLVLEVDPEPSSGLPIQDVERPRLWIPGNDDKHQYRCWKLYPSNSLGFVGCFDESNDRLFHGAGRPHSENWFRFHVTEHNRTSFLERFPLLCLDQGAGRKPSMVRFHGLITQLWLALVGCGRACGLELTEAGKKPDEGCVLNNERGCTQIVHVRLANATA